MKKMLNFNITEPLFQRVVELAASKGLSVTEVIRRAVEEFLKQSEERKNG
jgi:hypothetical protein